MAAVLYAKIIGIEGVEYMNVWQSGCESTVLDNIITGRKTVEGRLNRGKFAQYQPGDLIELRRDIRADDGVLRDGDAPEVCVEVVAVRHYDSFLDMVSAEGYARVIPDATSAKQAAGEYEKYYSAQDQAAYGVLGIEIKPLSNTQ